MLPILLFVSATRKIHQACLSEFVAYNPESVAVSVAISKGRRWASVTSVVISNGRQRLRWLLARSLVALVVEGKRCNYE